MNITPELAKRVSRLPSMEGAGPIEEITKVKCLSASGTFTLTEGKTYGVIEWQEGIFPDRPYILIYDDKGSKTAAHASRFAPVE